MVKIIQKSGASAYGVMVMEVMESCRFVFPHLVSYYCVKVSAERTFGLLVHYMHSKKNLTNLVNLNASELREKNSDLNNYM